MCTLSSNDSSGDILRLNYLTIYVINTPSILDFRQSRMRVHLAYMKHGSYFMGFNDRR